MAAKLKIPKIPEEQRTPLVCALLEIIQFQQEQIQELRDEIARLKGQKPKPKIRPSTLENDRGKKTHVPHRTGIGFNEFHRVFSRDKKDLYN
jgi:hypothetical protein